MEDQWHLLRHPQSRATLWSQRLRPDGLGLQDVPHRLLSADRGWQRGIVEEPAAVPASHGGWWLFYSGDSYDQPGYSIGLAWCRTLTESCTETSGQPLLRTKGDQRSPGGLGVLLPSGRQSRRRVRHLEPAAAQRPLLLLPLGRRGLAAGPLTQHRGSTAGPGRRVASWDECLGEPGLTASLRRSPAHPE